MNVPIYCPVCERKHLVNESEMRSRNRGAAMNTYYITPTLFLGDPPVDWSRPVIRVDTAKGAEDVIRSGGVALLPADDWQDAMTVLEALGLDQDAAEKRLEFARTGRMATDVPEDRF